MEEFKNILLKLKETVDIEEFIEQRKKECLEENQKISKQNPKQFGINGKKKIGINRMTKSTFGGIISASSDFIEEDREVAIAGGVGNRLVSIVTGNLDDTYLILLKKLKNRNLDDIDFSEIVHMVYQTVNEYFGTKGRVDRYNVLKEEDLGVNTLSDLKGRNLAACVERALLSQNLFKILGIDSTIKQSSITNNRKEEGHAYNILRVDNKNYIYDSSMAKVVDGKKTEPIVGTISDEEYMLIIDGTSRYGAKTRMMENGIIYDSSFGHIDEELEKLTPEAIESFRRQAKLQEEKESSVLKSAVQATEGSTKEGIIKTQKQTIIDKQKDRIQPENRSNKYVGEDIGGE